MHNFIPKKAYSHYYSAGDQDSAEFRAFSLQTYLESETEVKNFQLTKDQILILNAGIVTTEIIEERWDGKTYSLKARIAADPNDVANPIDKLRQDRHKTKELEETRKEANEALREVERLKKQLEMAKAEKTNSAQYDQAIKRPGACRDPIFC